MRYGWTLKTPWICIERNSGIICTFCYYFQASTQSTAHWLFSSEGWMNALPFMCVCVLCCFSRVGLFAILWTVVHQTPLSMGFSRQTYWSTLPFPTPGELPDPGIEPMSLMFPALTGRFSTTRATGEAIVSRDFVLAH